MARTTARGEPAELGAAASSNSGLTMAGLFSGVGGLELGLIRAGFSPRFMCESWQPARKVLTHRMAGIPLGDDVTTVDSIPQVDLLAAGFPCTDLSLAGNLVGITGQKSGLVEHVFRLAAASPPDWILLENVPHMLTLHSGAAMRLLTSRLESLGYRWAYRTVDTRFTGTPQRRPRVLLLASRSNYPEVAILGQDSGPPPNSVYDENAYGFYWTEGRRGLGLVRDAIPPLKGGSTIGIPSQPAVWLRNAPLGLQIVLPSLRDGERLQGLPANWTMPAATPRRNEDHRWKMVGNAVTTQVSAWVGRQVIAAIRTKSQGPADGRYLDRSTRWPPAGWGSKNDGTWTTDVSAWPRRYRYVHLRERIDLATAIPLSYRATSGFLRRLLSSGISYPADFLVDLQGHQAYMLSQNRSKDANLARQLADPLLPSRLASPYEQAAVGQNASASRGFKA